MTINAINIIPKKTASCPEMGDYAIAKKMNVKWGKQKKGDIVLFDFNHNGTSDHIGILVSVNKDGSITTIEGNTGSGSNTNGGEVQKRTRYKSQVNYFIRPKYNKEVTADMVIATAKSQIGVKESPKNSNKVKYNVWFYGKNVSAYWCCTFVCWVFAYVEEAKKVEIKPIAKPTGKYDGTIPSPTIKKGMSGSNVKNLQKFLNWYGGFGLEVDGEDGDKTDYALRVFQKTEGIEPDGIYGSESQKKAKAYKGEVKTTNADKLVFAARQLAWPAGTAEEKWVFKTGNPTTACATAMKKRGYGKTKKKSKNRSQFSDCGFVQNTCIYVAFGIKVKVLPSSAKKAFPAVDKMSIVHKGKKVPSGFLRAGDIIRYKKTNGAQHTLMYIGNGYIAEGGRNKRFFVIKKDEKKYNKSNVRHSTIEVLRII